MYLMFYLHTETDTQTQIYVKDIILQNNQTGCIFANLSYRYYINGIFLTDSMFSLQRQYLQ